MSAHAARVRRAILSIVVVRCPRRFRRAFKAAEFWSPALILLGLPASALEALGAVVQPQRLVLDKHHLVLFEQQLSLTAFWRSVTELDISESASIYSLEHVAVQAARLGLRLQSLRARILSAHQNRRALLHMRQHGLTRLALWLPADSENVDAEFDSLHRLQLESIDLNLHGLPCRSDESAIALRNLPVDTLTIWQAECT